MRSSATTVEIVFYWPGDQRSLARRVPPPPPLEAGHGDGDLGTVRLPRRQGRARRPPQGPVQCPRLRGDLVVSPPPDGTAASRSPGRSPALAPRRAGSPDPAHSRPASSANIPGKALVFMPLPGFRTYVEQCDEVAAKGYEGFAPRNGPALLAIRDILTTWTFGRATKSPGPGSKYRGNHSPSRQVPGHVSGWRWLAGLSRQPRPRGLPLPWSEIPYRTGPAAPSGAAACLPRS